MNFKLSDHAKKRMEKRKVKIEWVQAALDHPDSIEDDKEDVSACFKGDS